MGLSQQEYWSILPLPPPGGLPNPRNEPPAPALAGRFFTTEPSGKPYPWNSYQLLGDAPVPSSKFYAHQVPFWWALPFSRHIHTIHRVTATTFTLCLLLIDILSLRYICVWLGSSIVFIYNLVLRAWKRRKQEKTESLCISAYTSWCFSKMEF